MEDLVRVGVADAAEDVRVGERPFERVALAGKRGAELVDRHLQRLDAAGIVRAQRLFAADDVDRRTALRACFGEDERAVVEVERRETEFARDLRPFRQPLQPAGDHEVEDDEHLVLEREDDALAEAAKGYDAFAGEIGGRGLDGPQHERVAETEFLERMAEHA
jgi:hypothetical protein